MKMQPEATAADAQNYESEEYKAKTEPGANANFIWYIDRFPYLKKLQAYSFFTYVLGVNKLIRLVDPKAKQPFLSIEDYPELKILQDNWKVIREEFEQLVAKQSLPNLQDISSPQSVITSDDKWKTYILKVFGKMVDKNCEAMPKTAALLRQVPGMEAAMFSVIHGNKHVPPHRGGYCGLVRAHLGVKVPQPAEQCRIKVDGETVHWDDGSLFIIDDTCLHEAWNDSDEVRVVVLIDLRRRLPWPLTALNKSVLKVMSMLNISTEVFDNLERFQS